MGKVIVKIKLTNFSDLSLKTRGLSNSKPRSTEVEAHADDNPTRLYLNSRVIRYLGLKKTDDGSIRGQIHESVRLEVRGRHGHFNVVDSGESGPNILGRIPLMHLDFVVDSKNRKLIPNPEHGDKQMSEEY